MAEVPLRLSGALAGALERGRERFNAKFAEVRAAGRRVDERDFQKLLAEVVSPIVESVAVFAPGKIDSTTVALFDLSLDLMSRELLGCDGPIDRAWRQLLPRIPGALVSAPHRVVGAMSNAIHNLSQTPGTRPGFWLDEMTASGSLFRTGDELLAVGGVVAWRSGAAHLRRSALDSVASLRPELATAALGIEYSADVHTVVERLLKDPWLDPVTVAKRGEARPELRIRSRVGAFRGFGGIFHTPPTVVLVDGQFLVGDDESTWVLWVDRFGATFTRAGLIEPDEEIYDPDPELRLTESGTVHAGGNMARLEELAGASSWASDGDTLVATLPYSHAVRVVSAR
jgi:hypothetical protein